MTKARKPSGYMITIDGEVVASAGKNGVVADEDVALRLRDALKLSNPENVVNMYGLFVVAES